MLMDFADIPKDPVSKQLLQDDPIIDNGKQLPRKQVRRTKVPRKSSRPNQLTLTSSLNLEREAQLHHEDPDPDESLSVQTTTGNSKSRNNASFDLNSDINVSENLDMDPNIDRRKRQRTVSPFRDPSSPKLNKEGSWEDQLKAAAADDQSQVGISRSQALVSSEPETGMLKPWKPSPEETHTLGQRTPMKNILKLGSDGKLGSPKSRVPANLGKSKRKKGVPGRQGASETRIVIIKYCKDEESRSTMAQKIQDILTRPISVADALPVDKELPQKTKTHTHGLPKPTHPFFLGKVIHQEDVTALDAISTCSKFTNPQQPDDKIISPAKKPVPVSGADAAAAWAKLGGLSRNSGISTTKPKFPGALEPLWPPQDMVHIRSLSPCIITDLYQPAHISQLPARQKKLKTVEVQVLDEESVLSPLTQWAHTYQTDMDVEDHVHIPSTLLRKPQRLVMTGHELLEDLRQNLYSTLPSTTPSSLPKGGFITPYTKPPVNNALLRIFGCIPDSFTAFDKFECEAQEWVHKYAPKCAADVLQLGREVVLLRDWLGNLTVTSIDSGNRDASGHRDSSVALKRARHKSRKKRKRVEELDGFIISSEEEADKMDDLTDPEDPLLLKEPGITFKRSLIRAGESSGLSKSSGDLLKSTNTVVISGPHGCGKTAAVYAVAQELGFEVFEINAGSRRSGRDILDRVGDMTRNHLVHRAPENQNYDSEGNDQYGPVEQKSEPQSQSTMNAFLKPKAKTKVGSKSSRTSTSIAPKQLDSLKKQPNQKQSLILLEEVDILFEEDKQFWITVLGLISQSRRPIIMTCTDEKRLPLDEMTLHAIFRLAPLPEEIAVDYLLLLAGNEGHLLSRLAVSSLYKAKNADLRASISELNFWCQMAVGDSKGGLEWLPIPSPTANYRSANGERQRVVSRHSYAEDMGMLSYQTPKNTDTGSIVDCTGLLEEALYGWDVNVEDWHELIDGHALAVATSHISRESILQALSTAEQVLDTISAADVLPGLGLRNDNSVSPTTLCLCGTDTDIPRLSLISRNLT